MKDYTPNEHPVGRGHIKCDRCGKPTVQHPLATFCRFTPLPLEERIAVWEAEKDKRGRLMGRVR